MTATPTTTPAPYRLTPADWAGVTFAALCVVVAACLWLFVPSHDARIAHGLVAASSQHSAVAADQLTDVTEDSPRWDPATMGNGLAGAVWAADGSIVCPARMVPWDTEDVAVGDHGVVCRSTVDRG